MKYFLLSLSIMISFSAFSQGFITGIDQENLDLLMNKPTKVILASGEEVTGKLVSAMVLSGYLDKITLKKENDEKVKLKPEDILRLSVKVSKLAKLTMLSESVSSIKNLVKADFAEIVNREYIIFETSMRSNKAGKLRLMQLLNPGFDSKIKVFADPNANKTGSIGIGGFKLTGGEDRSYLFVENGEKAVMVRKGNYNKDFDELYQNCPNMLEVFEGEKVKWDDVAGHVFVYDQICK